MGFRRVAPQVVEHSDGYRVQSGGRLHVDYLEGARTARIDVEHGLDTISMYPRSIRWIAPIEGALTDAEGRLVVDRIRAGLEAMGSRCDVATAAQEAHGPTVIPRSEYRAPRA
ncbi:MAG: hypothetical protein ABI658_11875 [Acidimicrobiales bacterium]